MMLDHTVGVHDQVSWDAADLCWRWSGRTPTALWRCRARRELCRRGPPGRQARAGCLYVPRQVGSSCASQTVSDWSACEGSRRLWREPCAPCVRDSPHLDRWFRATPRATTSTSESTSTPTTGVGLGIARSGSPTGARAKSPRVDRSPKAVVAGPVTNADVTQSEDRGPHTKTPW